MWKRIADVSWLTLFAVFGVWLAGWLLGVYSWAPALPIVAGTAGYFAALETVLLLNKEPNDTLSERIRRIARMRSLVPLVWGMVGGAGIVLATLTVDWTKLRAAGVIAILSGLTGHFFVPPQPTRRLASMPLALFSGLGYGVFVAAIAAIDTSEVNDLLAFVCVALFGVFVGARFFELRD